MANLLTLLRNLTCTSVGGHQSCVNSFTRGFSLAVNTRGDEGSQTGVQTHLDKTIYLAPMIQINQGGAVTTTSAIASTIKSMTAPTIAYLTASPTSQVVTADGGLSQSVKIGVGVGVGVGGALILAFLGCIFWRMFIRNAQYGSGAAKERGWEPGVILLDDHSTPSN